MDRLDEVLNELREFVTERDWEQFHDTKNLAMAVASEAGELLAEYRWLRNDEADEWSRMRGHLERVTSEAADVAITLLLFCDRLGIDPIVAIKRKIEVNRQRYPVDESKGRSQRPAVEQPGVDSYWDTDQEVKGRE